MALVEKKNITKIEITTTQAVDVEQLARDIRASIGYCAVRDGGDQPFQCPITMHAIMTNLCDVPMLRRHGILSGCEVIVHINRAVRETEVTGETGETELPGEGDGDGEPPLKKLKGPEEQKAPQRFIDAATIQTEILQDVSLFETYPGGGPKKTHSQLTLKICANSTLYLVNMAADSDKDATIAHGSILVGYGKGKWQQNGTCDAKELKYELQNSSQAVIFNSNLTTVGTLVCAKRLTAEADVARCCYHDMIESPSEDDKCAFNLRSTQEIFYVVNDVTVKRESNGAAPKAIQANAGSLIPPEQWDTEFTTMHWIVKWQSKKGLQPVRPQITWTGPSTAIPVGQALQLTP